MEELSHLLDSLEIQIKAKQDSYKNMLEDRARSLRRLVDIQKEIVEQKAAFHGLVLKLEEWRNGINTASRKRLRIHFGSFLLEKEKATLQERKQSLGEKQCDALALHKTSEDEVDRLQAVISAVKRDQHIAELNIAAVSKEISGLTTKLQAVQRELAAVQSKITAQDELLAQGRRFYDRLLIERATTWRAEGKLRKQRDSRQDDSEDAQELQQVVGALEAELMEEKRRTRALEDELRHPINVHRWQHLETTDPARYKLIQRCMNLTKQLVDTSARVQDLETQISAAKHVCQDTSRALSRASTFHLIEDVSTGGRGATEGQGTTKPRLPKKLVKVQSEVKAREAKVAWMEKDLRLAKTHVHYLEEDLKVLRDEQAKVTNLWFEECAQFKRKEDQAVEERRLQTEPGGLDSFGQQLFRGGDSPI